MTVTQHAHTGRRRAGRTRKRDAMPHATLAQTAGPLLDTYHAARFEAELAAEQRAAAVRFGAVVALAIALAAFVLFA